jgi:glutamate--cysteine ligase catalytic subunit
MEVQMTDFENAAFSIFIVLLSRAILTFGLNFYIPVSKVSWPWLMSPFIGRSYELQVDDNMERAQKRGSSRNTKFWFRRSIYPPGEERIRSPLDEVDLPTPPSERVDDDDLAIRTGYKGDCGRCSTHPTFLTESTRQRVVPVEEEYEEMTIDEIINGKASIMITTRSMH